jgi:hypothetical protein
MTTNNVISLKEVELEVDKKSLLRNWDSISSIGNPAFETNSREILLFRYPDRKMERA